MTERLPRRTKHASSWGKPQRDRSPAFYRAFGKIFEYIGNACRYTAYGLAVTALALLVYAGIFVNRVNAYASDGTVFSCHLPTIEGK